MKFHFETLQVHAGYTPDATNSRQVPIYPTTAYTFDSAGHGANLFNLDFEEGYSPYIYTRVNNPTNNVFEQRMAALEGGVAAVAVASGHSAQLRTMLKLLKTGDNIVTSPYLYGGTDNQVFRSFRGTGIKGSKATSGSGGGMEKRIEEKKKAL